MIKQGLKWTHAKIVYYDLDHLAGSWTITDKKNFEETTKYFERIDKDLWS